MIKTLEQYQEWGRSVLGKTLSGVKGGIYFLKPLISIALNSFSLVILILVMR